MIASLVTVTKLEKKPKKIKQSSLEARIFFFPVNLSPSNKLSILATKFGNKQNIMKVATFEEPSGFLGYLGYRNFLWNLDEICNFSFLI
jgi:hypothetical protein